MDEYLTPEEIAKLCRTTRQTVYNWLRRKKLPFRSFGKHYRVYISKADLPQFLKINGKKGGEKK